MSVVCNICERKVENDIFFNIPYFEDDERYDDFYICKICKNRILKNIVKDGTIKDCIYREEFKKVKTDVGEYFKYRCSEDSDKEFKHVRNRLCPFHETTDIRKCDHSKLLGD